MRILHAILTAIQVLFLALMLILRLLHGSFEVAGARMDRMPPPWKPKKLLAMLRTPPTRPCRIWPTTSPKSATPRTDASYLGS